jgi:Ni,Fe-hydrogenase III large subunit/Ni,Fe-hydrogenase III component G
LTVTDVVTSPTVDLQQLSGGELLPSRVPGETRVLVPLVTLPRACQAIVDGAGARLATMVAQDERAETGSFSLAYTFAMSDRRWMTIECHIPADSPAFPSVTPLVPAAHWYEREARDMFGLEPEGHPDLRRLVMHDDWPAGVYPLRKDFDPSIPVPRVEADPYRFHTLHGDGIVEIPVGPFHAGVIEPGHFRFAAVGEVVLALEPRLFYTHRGIEKLIEGKSLDHGLQIAERICGVCSLSHAVTYCQAAEQILGIEAPPRAAVIRSIGLELERLYNHVGDAGNMCAGVGFMVGIAHGARLKDDLQRLNEQFTGNRFLRGLATIGGVRRNLDVEFAARMSLELARIAREFGELTAMILGSETTMERMRRTGILPGDLARALGVVGVGARASGIDLDTRRDHPYAAYGVGKNDRDGETARRPDGQNLPPSPAVGRGVGGEGYPAVGRGAGGEGHSAGGGEGFPVPTREEGDVAARLLVRIDEVAVSFALIQALIADMPAGPLTTSWTPPTTDAAAFSATESPRGENLHWLRVNAQGTIERYRVRSASFPNWPAVAAAAPGNMVPDFPLINKSFELCYACLDR